MHMIIKQIPPSLVDGKIYFADEEGNIRDDKGKLKPQHFSEADKNHKGGSMYPFIRFGQHSKKAHNLICSAFWGIKQPGQVCHHLDGNKFNNRPDNLIWLFPEEHRRYDQLVKQGIILKHVNPLDAAGEERRKYADD